MIQQFDLAEIKELDWNDIFLGLKGNSVRIKFVNTVIIFMKYVIYKSRQKGSLPTVVKIEKSVLEFIEEEKKLAIKMGKLGDALVKVGIYKLREGRAHHFSSLFPFLLS